MKENEMHCSLKGQRRSCFCASSSADDTPHKCVSCLQSSPKFEERSGIYPILSQSECTDCSRNNSTARIKTPNIRHKPSVLPHQKCPPQINPFVHSSRQIPKLDRVFLDSSPLVEHLPLAAASPVSTCNALQRKIRSLKKRKQQWVLDCKWHSHRMNKPDSAKLDGTQLLSRPQKRKALFGNRRTQSADPDWKEREQTKRGKECSHTKRTADSWIWSRKSCRGFPGSHQS